MNTPHTSSHNLVVWELFDEAHKQLAEMRDGDNNCAKVACIIILVMAALEAFLNSYFHLIALHSKDAEFLKTVKTGRDNKRGLIATKDKILTWPKRISNKSIDINSPEYKGYDEVRILRDKLVHYKPNETNRFLPGGMTVMWVHEISFYKSLTKEEGVKSLWAILDLIGAIGNVMGQDKMMFVRHWTGPTYGIL